MELTSPKAAEVIGAAEATIRNYVYRGLLPARRMGIRKMIRIQVTDLRDFATEYGFVFNEEVLKRIESEKQ